MIFAKPSASAKRFRTKHLLIDYRLGEAHYLRYLTDGDWAHNDAAWQWSAGCGCGAQPCFRVFNPITQGEKFDPDGAYVRRYVPELARVPAEFIHRPFEALPLVLSAAGVRSARPTRARSSMFARRERFLRLTKKHFARG